MKIICKQIRMMAFLFFVFMTSSYADKGKINLDDAIQTVLDVARTRYGIPAIEVSVSFNNESSPRDYVSGTTLLSGSIPITSSTLFQIGSETKSYTSALLLQLEADHLLSLQDTLGQWLGNKVPLSWSRITIDQLLHHTSGINEFTDSLQFQRIVQQTRGQKQWTAQELINFVVSKPLYFQPGKGWRYSNTNYILAGLIIEAAALKTYQSVITQKLFIPLGLARSYYVVTTYNSDILQRMAHGYAPQSTPPYLTDVTNFNMSMAGSAGAIIANAHDVALWLRQLMTTDLVLPLLQKNKLMGAVNMKTGQSVPVTSPGYGLGLVHDFSTFGEEVWWHNGSTPGYLSAMVWLKNRDIVVTILLNVNKNPGVETSILKDVIKKL